MYGSFLRIFPAALLLAALCALSAPGFLPGAAPDTAAIDSSQPLNRITTPHSDLLYLEIDRVDSSGNSFQGRTPDGSSFRVDLSPDFRARTLRNLGEIENDCTAAAPAMLVPGRKVFAHGIFYPTSSEAVFEGQKLYFLGTGTRELRFEDDPDWWSTQVRGLADFYLRAQFPDGNIDYGSYRTRIALDGCRKPGDLQETDTISRLVYGFASAFLLTGEEVYFLAAEAGTRYLQDRMRRPGPFPGSIVWLHALDRDQKTGELRRILPSQFPDDIHSIPLYEQIYALSGPVQTLRITGDPAIVADVEGTQVLFDRAFLDPIHGGYFSHVDAVGFSPRAVSLGKNRSRKNWNSIGDHAPAYLINYYLATGKPDAARRLRELADLIVDRFPPRDGSSPFVRERFHEDWSPDTRWEWQKDRAVVGHNLKIAWNLMRLQALGEGSRYSALAERLAASMPSCGLDRQRGGWYDVVERRFDPRIGGYRFAFHDRKAWWQQEQAILAYLILAGESDGPDSGDAGNGPRRQDGATLRGSDWLAQARDAAAFYNAWFLDHDDGGVYFNVTADGIPYLRGNERLKGSHSMSGYHACELCYLGAVYNNLLVRKRPLDLFFRPAPSADRAFRVAPDLLPPGKVRIGAVEIEGRPHGDFDAETMVVFLPPSEKPLRVKVRFVPGNVEGEGR